MFTQTFKTAFVKKAKLNKIFILLSIFLFLSLTFQLFLFPNNNNDLGWHLKYGQYFHDHGQILKQNTFSYIMPSFIWDNSSWGYDILTFEIFNQFGFKGLTIAGALVGLILTIILLRFTKPNFAVGLLSFAPFYLIVSSVFYHGFRAQMLSLLGLIFCMWIVKKIEQKNLTNKDYFLTFSIFVFWANFHSEFVLGIAYIGLVFLGKIFDYLKNKKTKLHKNQYLLILIIAAFAGLFNPFGINIYLQAFEHIFTARLSTIFEWEPWPWDSWQLWFLIGYVLFLANYFLKNKNKINFATALPLVIFGLQAFLHRRMQAPLVVISFPVLIAALSCYKLKLKPITLLILLSLLNLWVFVKILPQRAYWIENWQEYCDSKDNMGCSEDMITFLQENKIQGKMFNFYNWGGYLIWRYPQEKVFIDGRMSAWKDKKTSYMPFDHYRKIHNLDKNSRQEFLKGNFDIAIVPANTIFDKMLFEKLAWQIIYKDQKAVVMAKPGYYEKLGI
jgi:hypothetical protein